jgi:hypothetical protein
MLAQTVIVHGGPYQAFFYPPPYLLLCAPLAGLPFFWSLGAFMAVTGLAYAAAIRLAARSCWVILAAVASPAVLVNLLVGQNAMLTAAILGAGLTLLDRRPRTAGLILGLMVIKPHLALAVPIALLVSRRWTVLGFAALSAVLVAAVSVAVFGVDVWHAFAADAGYPRRTLEQGLVRFELFQSAFAFTRQLGGSIPAAYTAQAVSAIAGLGLMVLIYSKRPSPAAERSAIVLASLLMTPYIIHYDLVILMVPLVWLLTEWTDTGFPPWGKLVLITGYLLPCAIYCWPSLHLGLLGMFGLLAFVAGRAGLRAAIPGAAVPA